MKLTELCLKRPIFAVVINLIVIILGVLSYSYLTLRYQPKVFMPEVTIRTTYPGASPAVVDQTITQKIEKHLQGTESLNQMFSASVVNMSFIQLSFDQISPTQFLRIQSEIASSLSKLSLPTQAQKPKISYKGEGNMLMAIGFQSAHLNPRAVGDFVQQNILPQLQQIPGVGDVRLRGPQSAIRIAVDPIKLSLYHLTFNDIVTRLQTFTQNLSLGSMITHNQFIELQLNQPNHISSFRDIVIAHQNNRLIRLKQVAKVFVGDTSYTDPQIVKIDGKPGVAIMVNASDDGNPITIGQQVKRELAALKTSMPRDMHVATIVDRSVLFSQSLSEVYKTMLEAIVLVCLITLLFLGSWRFTFIPIVTIPVCLIGGCIIILASGFSLNIMTLLAIVLAVGLVVDDAIVVLENVHRHIDQGQSAHYAASAGSKEVSFAIVGMTICLLAVYVPIGLMHGETAVYFRVFAFTLAGCVLISGFTALTLTPVLCQFLLTKKVVQKVDHGFGALINRFFERLRFGYANLLSKIIKARYAVLAIFMILIIFGGFMFTQLQTTFMPKDQSGLIIVRSRGVNTLSYESLAKANDQMMQQIAKLPGVSNYITSTAMSNGQVAVFNMIHLSGHLLNNTNLANKLVKQIKKILQQHINLATYARLKSMMSHISTDSSSSIEFSLQGNVSYEQLFQAGTKLGKALAKEPSLSGEPPSIATKPTLSFDINWDQVNKLQIDPATLIKMLSTAFSGTQLTNEFNYDGNSYPIIVQMPKTSLADTHILNHLYINTISQPTNLTQNRSMMIPLARVISTHNSVDLPYYLRLNGSRSIQMSYDPSPGYTLGSGINTITKTAQAILPAGVHLQFSDDAAQLAKNRHTMTLIFILGTLFIYLVLAALFESLIDPLIILFTVPLCIIGALVTLWFVNGSINLFTTIGLVTLVGLVSKHGVLITQFANDQISKGLAKREAVIQAASIRLRPILMTSLTMILGAIPLIIQQGAGSNSRSQLGWVIVSGLIVGTLFSLFIVPVAYDFLSKREHKQVTKS